jgi:hypothetical protein
MAEQEYSVPAPVIQEHYYLQAAVIELQRIRASLEAITAAMQNPPPPGEVVLREPEKPPKPKRG